MSAGSDSRRLALAFGVALAACRGPTPDPPPPPSRDEVPRAPPGALGALAAGTDAAPTIPEPQPTGRHRQRRGAPHGVPDAFPESGAGGEASTEPPDSESVPL